MMINILYFASGFVLGIVFNVFMAMCILKLKAEDK